MTTATVKTLTAEVRTLVVGKRQVTLSVYRQLDSAHLEEVEPFGRVRDDRDDGPHVVGRHRETGALVRAAYMPPWVEPTAPIEADDLDGGAIIVCSAHWKHNGIRREHALLRFQERMNLKVHRKALTTCDIPGHHDGRHGEECPGWDPNGHDEQIRAKVLIHEEHLALCRSAAELPLIVLAGLK